MLPDVLKAKLRVVFCGTAAGKKSAEVKQYYAGPGNKFWKTLCEVGLTRVCLKPEDYERVLKYGIGLTDLVKGVSGSDNELDFKLAGPEALRAKMTTYAPKILCFNGKRAAEVFLAHSVSYGIQKEKVGDTTLFVAPSTSGAANGYWDIKKWKELATLLDEMCPSDVTDA